MADNALALWSTFYTWAAAQPVFIQIPLGIGLFFAACFAATMLFLIVGQILLLAREG